MESLHEDHATASTAHDEVEKLYRHWLDQGSLDSADRQKLTQTLEELSKLYQPHIALEDSELFPMAQRALNAEQIEGLGREMAQRRHISFRTPDLAPLAPRGRGG
jgi:hemerythrin-like domain-containing protein